MIANAIQAQFGKGANWPLGAALSVTTMAVVTAMAESPFRAALGGGPAPDERPARLRGMAAAYAGLYCSSSMRRSFCCRCSR